MSRCEVSEAISHKCLIYRFRCSSEEFGLEFCVNGSANFVTIVSMDRPSSGLLHDIGVDLCSKQNTIKLT